MADSVTADFVTSDNVTLNTLFNKETTTRRDADDVRSVATSYLMYKIGEAINKSYFPILVPVGVVGNILSFLVMIQKHNRHMSFSLYISVLAVTDTISLIVALCRYLDTVDGIKMPQDQVWYCKLTLTMMLMSTMCSTLFILNMTFDRFYSIVRPHKAASFNTVKRAKITIICSIIFSIFYNIPHIFLSSSVARQCVPYGNALKVIYGQFYYWLSIVVNYLLPFVLLLTMNSVIIHTLRKRSSMFTTVSQGEGPIQGQGYNKGQNQGHNRGKGQTAKIQGAERQIFITLLLVTFSFLILTTPAYVFFFYQMFYDYTALPQRFAGFYLYNSVAQKAMYTNNGINFFLYVISGKKFREDLVKLFSCCKCGQNDDSPSGSSGVNTVSAAM